MREKNLRAAGGKRREKEERKREGERQKERQRKKAYTCTYRPTPVKKKETADCAVSKRFRCSRGCSSADVNLIDPRPSGGSSIET